ncbi:thermonuclease family protein [Pseudochrobactrum kiredjianiae]|uniref:Thermonuclease family protein n=1 Tax=Pseudochrobactrum kiredjianiae TaxID=386305 RepID=A0ABW3V287_9HYPH|nr:thermonuclease family protein [Pseudochrobactrum kiredjianiae]MDM7851667.1 thermonuclease family protein [Pseudochrobactrum kiredjianiae]
MKPPTSGRRPQPYRPRTPRRQYRRPQRTPYSFLRRSGIAAALLLLGIYAALQTFMPDWPGLLSPDSPFRPESSATNRTQPAPAQLSGRGSSLHIYDGDTIAIQGQRIRFKGMDTPESAQSCDLNGKAYACGDYATAELRKLIGGQTVTCTSEGRDQYKRILAYCKAGDIDLNRTMVAQGWAVSYGLYQREEADARKNKRGLWAGNFERPAKWRKNNQPRYNDRNQSQR